MSSRIKLIEQQRAWADSAGHAVDAHGYLGCIESNLLSAFSSAALHGFGNGSGSELIDSRCRPAKIKAPHSSAALAVNVFDYWVVRDAQPLADSLNLHDSIEHVTFEAQFPTGLKGNPPNLDVAIQLRSDATIAIESKFTEWLAPKSPQKASFKPKYFPQGQGLWERNGLPLCQALAASIYNGRERFRYLDTPQLLKHALGLAANLGSRFSLYYLYYDSPSLEAQVHGAEIKRFTAKVGTELRFHCLSYQTLFSRLSQFSALQDLEYIDYLRARYFAPECSRSE